MRQAHFRISGALLLVGLVLSAPLLAQEADRLPTATAVRPGDYNDLNFWRTLRLGAASLVNTDAVKAAQVAYKYPAQNINPANQKIANDLIKEGRLSVGTSVAGGPTKVDALQAVDLAKVINGGGVDVVIVTPQPVAAFGEGIPIVSWDASKQPSPLANNSLPNATRQLGD
jgi:hypothetical protein